MSSEPLSFDSNGRRLEEAGHVERSLSTSFAFFPLSPSAAGLPIFADSERKQSAGPSESSESCLMPTNQFLRPREFCWELGKQYQWAQQASNGSAAQRASQLKGDRHCSGAKGRKGRLSGCRKQETGGRSAWRAASIATDGVSRQHWTSSGCEADSDKIQRTIVVEVLLALTAIFRGEDSDH